MWIRHVYQYPLIVTFFLFTIWSCKSNEEQRVETKATHVLIFSKTKAYRHECIEPGSAALKSYFEKYGMTTTLSEDSTLFTIENLKPFDVVMFFQTTGNVLDSAQQTALESFIRNGKGFVGVHAAADTEYEWPWYGNLVGSYFAGSTDIQSAALQKTDTAHLACKHLPDRWARIDEWYNFKQLPTKVSVLLTIDEATYHGGAHGSFHPMAWCHTYDGGRAFYTALGHTVESYKDTLFLEHLRQGVLWAAGKS